VGASVGASVGTSVIAAVVTLGSDFVDAAIACDKIADTVDAIVVPMDVGFSSRAYRPPACVTCSGAQYAHCKRQSTRTWWVNCCSEVGVG
jgi:hypothetical protein